MFENKEGYINEFWIPEFNEKIEEFFNICKEWRDDPENSHSLMFNSEVGYYLSEEFRSDPTNNEYVKVWDQEKTRLESLFDININNFMISVKPKT